MRKLQPGWPAEVAPPDTPDWERSAATWLYELVPVEIRRYDVFRRHPRLLARFARDSVGAQLDAARQGWRRLRGDLRGELPPDVLDDAMTAYEREGQRLSDLLRSVEVVEAALRGLRWVPPL